MEVRLLYSVGEPLMIMHTYITRIERARGICKGLFSLALVLSLFASCGGKKGDDAKTATQEKKNNIAVDTALTSRLKKFAAAPRCKGLFGFYVYDLTADKPVYGEGQKVTMASASCLKLITGVAGLHLLGTEYSYPTSLWTTGTMNKDTLQGNVIFKAQLDPQLNEPDLKMFPEELKKRGIKTPQTGHEREALVSLGSVVLALRHPVQRR